MTTHQRLVGCLLMSSLAATSIGCTSMRTIPPATEPAAPTFGRVKAGDTVLVELRDGRRERFVVQRVDGDVIVSMDGVRYTRSDIARLQRQSFSLPRTALLVLGIYAAYMAVVIAVVYAKFFAALP